MYQLLSERQKYLSFSILASLFLLLFISACSDEKGNNADARGDDASNPLVQVEGTDTKAIPGTGMPAGKDMLILHDTSGDFGYVGVEYALMLENLLGHFNAQVTVKPVNEYASGNIDDFDVVFYIGSTYDESSYYGDSTPQALNYTAFLDDAATTDIPVAWLNYNLWRFVARYNESRGAGAFPTDYGFEFNFIDNKKYNRVKYKNIELYKGVVVHANPGAQLATCEEEGDGKYACALETSLVSVIDETKVNVFGFFAVSHG